MSMRLNGLTVTHRHATLVDVANLNFERGRPVTIVGESGSGKSLLAHAIMGTLPSALTAQGSLVTDGQAYNLAEAGNRRELWGPVMSLLPQEPMLALDPTMRARDQVAEGASSFATDAKTSRQSAVTLLTSLGLGCATAAYPHTLSGGMAQRVAFAAATIGGAPILIADEPSKGLDGRALAELAGLLKWHVDGGGILLTITHDLALARKIGGDVLVMKDAHVVQQGPALEVLTQPAHPYTRRLLAAGTFKLAEALDGTPGASARSRFSPRQRRRADQNLRRAEALLRSLPRSPLRGTARAKRSERQRQNHAGERPAAAAAP